MPGLRERLEAHREPFDAILRVATCSPMLGFGDIAWEPMDLDRVREQRDPGVMLESPVRVVVVEEHGGELRYYAGGWRSDKYRLFHEYDQMMAEGSETGTFPSDEAAVAFAERFLVRLEPIQAIDTPREHRFRTDTDVTALAREPAPTKT